MRQIRFRAWNKEENKMSDVFTFSNFDRDFYIEGNWYLEDMEIMQFTGLKDKNGVEIYEGDILQHDFYEGKESQQIIEWVNGRRTYETFTGFDYPDDLMDYTVAGNIYENPELLKNEN